MVPYFPKPLIARSLELVAPAWTDAKGRWGVIDPARTGPYARRLTEGGAIPHDRGWEGSFSNDLLPATRTAMA